MADASCAIVNGAVSLVNAIAARKGATLWMHHRWNLFLEVPMSQVPCAKTHQWNISTSNAFLKSYNSCTC